MLNITQITIDEQREREEPSYSFLGGVTGFVFYWLAFAIPFFVYGPNTVFFLLYTAVLFSFDAGVSVDRDYAEYAIAR